MPELYILFEKSNTFIGKIGRVVMPYPYTHVAISFDKENYYSFSRRKHNNPFDAGFTKEKLSYYAYEDVEVKIYTININEEEKEKIELFMDRVKDYPFDVIDMLTMPILHGHKHKNAYNCMSFVSEILEILNYPLMHKRYKNNIEDIEKALKVRGEKGEIIHLNKQYDEEYMSKVTNKEIINSFITLLKKIYK